MSPDAAALLARSRNADGGFGPRAGAPSEPEPTAVAALALDDDRARAWLVDHQDPDGSWSLRIGPYVNDSATALGALALGPGPERERAMDHVESTRARRVDSTDAIPIDASAIGWAWASGTASWVEPTARALWALRLLRPTSPSIEDAVALLRDRECVSGGWNYGNRVVLGEDLPPYAETTAVALIGLRDMDGQLEARGLETLGRLSRIESSGGLSLATALAAFRIHGATVEADRTRRTLDRLVDETGLLDDTVALGWTGLASGDRLPGAVG